MLKEGFLGTAAPRAADLVLLLEIAMGAGLLFGAWLARTKRFRQHAWCQSSVVLLNLAVVSAMMIPSFSRIVHPAVCGHECSTGKIETHEIQVVDAMRPCALVDRAVTGNSDIHAVVRAESISELDQFSDSEEGG